jgi:hypothetical protein
VTEDLRFTWRPPIGFPERVTTISAGTYTYTTTNYEGHIYSSADGRVSVAISGSPSVTESGGIGIDKFHGHFYVWQASTTIAVEVPVGPLTVRNKGGDAAYPYIGRIPKELWSKIVTSH